jgi:chromosome segregation ATPase
MFLIMKMSAKQTPDFSAVSKMIDDMLAVLDNEQVEDVNKKEWCFTEISKADKEAGSKQETVDQLKAEIEQVSDEIGGLDDDLKALGESITGLDKEVAMSTEQRKKEHEEYTASLQMTEAAIALIGKAKNRLAKFYNPTVYKAPPKKEATMEEKIIQSYGFVQRHSIMHTVSLKKQMPDLPDMPTYEKKNSGGVVALLDKISLDLEKDSVEAGHDEKTAQQDYVEFMAESQASRAQDQKTMVDKQGSKAELEKKLVEAKSTMATSMEELQNSHELLSEIHNQCDFMVENFEMRKTARTAEIESLKSAKATLAGASF